MEGKNAVRNKFKTPEGRYELVAERNQNLVQFHYQRCTRLCLAHLQSGSPEDGSYLLFNVGDLLHISRINQLHKEAMRSLQLCSASPRSFPTCFDFLSSQKSESADLLVGLSDGPVHLLSLRAHLSSPPGSKPSIAATITPEANQEVRCVSVLWLPKSDGMFVAGFSNGNVHVYRKSAILGESGSRFSLGLGSSGKSTSPHSVISVSGQGIHDLAVSPCGTRLAAACCDGSLRILDVASGALLSGCQSYYGALLCCTFSPDGRFVAAGGEDDLVAVYSLAERIPIAILQGHDSWLSRVQWDPWLQYSGSPPSGGDNGLGPSAEQSSVYRLASGGQDAQLCLWDVQTGANDGTDILSTHPVNSSHLMSVKRSGSLHNMHGSPMRGDSGTPNASNHQRKPSLGKCGGVGVGITPSLPRAEMNFVQPSMRHKVHHEPMSDVVFTDQYVITSDHSGCLRQWKRPGLGRRSLSLHTNESHMDDV